MDSFLTWLDTTEEQRQRALTLADQFRQRDTRDELGIGQVRDAFSELFFPGTSTIQTRARYFLFIPWIYKRVERKDLGPDEFSEEIQTWEEYLIGGLLDAGAEDGLIGKQAKSDLKRFPSSIYWRGLREWGILRFPGSRAQYHRSITRRGGDGGGIDLSDGPLGSGPARWREDIPQKADGFPWEINFELPPHEAEYLRERILESQPRSLLATMLDLGNSNLDVEFPWTYPVMGELPDRQRDQLAHARNFSEIMHGAVLLYNLMLAEKSERPNLQADFRSELADWASLIEDRQSDFDAWSLADFWALVDRQSPRVPSPTEQFITEWIEQARRKPREVQDEARTLISRRELRLKGKRARLHNRSALDLWSGGSGLGRLEYRWNIAKTHIRDILAGLEDT